MKSLQFLRFSLRSCFLLWSSAFLLSVSPMVTPMARLSSTNISRSLQLKFFSFFFYKEGARKYNFLNHENTRRTYLSVNLKCEVLIGGVSESGISLFSLQYKNTVWPQWPFKHTSLLTLEDFLRASSRSSSSASCSSFFSFGFLLKLKSIDQLVQLKKQRLLCYLNSLIDWLALNFSEKSENSWFFSFSISKGALLPVIYPIYGILYSVGVRNLLVPR